MSALHREWINDQAERVTLEAPEMRPVGQVPCVPTSTGLLIGCNYRRPMPQPSADAERIQAALLAKPARRTSDGWAFWLTLLACVLVFLQSLSYTSKGFAMAIGSKLLMVKKC
jgi:hypothetical protein